MWGYGGEVSELYAGVWVWGLVDRGGKRGDEGKGGGEGTGDWLYDRMEGRCIAGCSGVGRGYRRSHSTLKGTG